jgi:hypothetical protein
MALPTEDCFKGLDWQQQYAAIYEALFTAAEDDTLVSPDCFLGLDQREQMTAVYAALLVIIA